MAITVNHADVLAMTLTMPTVGVWVLSAELAADDPPTGAITVEDTGVSLAGRVMRAGVVAGVTRIEAVGGAGRMGVPIDARSYQSARASEVVGDLLAAAGEKLDTSSSRAVLASPLSYWTRAGGRPGAALTTLTEAIGARWRVRPGGAIWVGTETWPKVADDFDAQELDRDQAAGMVLLAPYAISLMPGVLLNGDRVGRVEHTVGRDAEVRTVYWTEA